MRPKKSKLPAICLRAASLLLLYGALVHNSLAAPGDVDLSFDAGSGVNGAVKTMALQPDGKLIIGGTFSTVRGFARVSLARLNPDGSGDPTFDAGTNADQSISAIAIQPDGKVLFTREYGAPVGGKLVLLDTNGRVDASFVPAFDSLPYSNTYSTTCVAVQPDGRILVGGYSTHVDGSGNPYPVSLLIRLNANGAIDNTFTNDTEGAFGGIIYSVELQPDGKILVAGNFGVSVNGTNHYGVARLNTNGALDTNFQFGADGIVHSVGLQSDGKILLAGYGIGNSTNWNGIARLNANGSLDGSFQPGIDANSSLISSVVQPDGKVVCIGSYVYVGGTNRNGLVRLNSNGSLDATFNASTGGPNNAGAAIVLQPDGKILISGGFTLVNGTNREHVARLNSNGTRDAGFNPGSGINASVNSLTLQSDGKVIIGGDFTMAGGATRNRVARLNTNGSLDTSFDPDTGPDGLHVTALAMQPNGKVLVGGDFSSFNGVSRYRLVRLNTNGTVDTTFVPWAGAPLNYAFQPSTFLVQPDGKILVGSTGDFYGSDGSGLARLNPDGSFDNSFHAETLATNDDHAVISSLALQPDGKILAGGYSVKSAWWLTYYLFTRLNTNGTRDTSFPAAGGSGGIVTSIALQPDGKMLVGGWHGNDPRRIARFNTNGSADNTFNVGSGANDSINSVLLQPDGKILIAGSFTNFNGTNCNRIARLNSNGSVDMQFNVSAQVGVVSAAALQPDGNILINGGLITTNGAMRLGLARLYGDSTLPLLSIARTNISVIVRWPATALNVQLQASTNLSLANGWSLVGNARATNNGIVSVTLPVIGAGHFFRLSSP